MNHFSLFDIKAIKNDKYYYRLKLVRNKLNECFIFHSSKRMLFRLLNEAMMKYNNVKSLLWDMIKGFESFSCVCYCKKLVFMTIYLDISLVSLCNVLPLFIILNIATCNSILLSFLCNIVLTFNTFKYGQRI